MSGRLSANTIGAGGIPLSSFRRSSNSKKASSIAIGQASSGRALFGGTFRVRIF